MAVRRFRATVSSFTSGVKVLYQAMAIGNSLQVATFPAIGCESVEDSL